jgi:hypothetical protein
MWIEVKQNVACYTKFSVLLPEFYTSLSGTSIPDRGTDVYNLKSSPCVFSLQTMTNIQILYPMCLINILIQKMDNNITYPGFPWLINGFGFDDWIRDLYTTSYNSSHCHRLSTGHWTGTSLTSNWTELSIRSQSQSYVTTNGHSASLSSCQAPMWGLRLEFYYCQTVADLLMWGAVSDERTGLPFITDAGPRQRSHSWVRVPWDSWPYFTLSESKLPLPGGPGPRIYVPPGTVFLFVASYD